MNGTKGRTAPDLTDATWLHIDGSYDSIVHIISTGVPAADFKSPTSRFPMRPMGGMPLTDAQVHDVAAYVYTLSHH
jgi:mono/diheme cytochrome c family protein